MRNSFAGTCAAGLLVLLALAGCHALPVAPSASAPWEVRRPALQALPQFVVKGRVAVATGTTGFNANLRWTQEADSAHLSLEGPLGMGAVQVSSMGDNLEVINSHGEHIGSDAARAELRNRLGFDVPLASLRYWILGVPRPGVPAQESLDAAQQRLEALNQDGWHIAYDGYVDAHGQTLPARLTLEREAVRVRLIVDDWQL
ncbi:MAG TPA: lipoprotein insertase outer membrane protein LolB [Steroidobacteraceae bacterium]|jgi:outer membrane lipoprotein LolB